MQTISTATRLLAQKQELFQSYLQATQAMMDCELDDLEAHLQERTGLAGKIDLLDTELAGLCEGAPQMGLAVKNKCDRGDLPGELLPVFDAAQSVFAVINQVANLEPQIVLRMQDARQELEGLIKASNTKPKIARYLDTLDPTLESGSLMRAQSSKV